MLHLLITFIISDCEIYILQYFIIIAFDSLSNSPLLNTLLLFLHHSGKFIFGKCNVFEYHNFSLLTTNVIAIFFSWNLIKKIVGFDYMYILHLQIKICCVGNQTIKNSTQVKTLWWLVCMQCDLLFITMNVSF